jgi:3-hydroxyacyl-[acyl-carrier-protein] dehydratase
LGFNGLINDSGMSGAEFSDPKVRALGALPHGAEFRFIDEVVELDPGRCGRAVYRVRGDEAILRGHFPGRPLVPGVILIEALAQLAGIIAQSDPSIPPLDDLRLAAIRSAKITGTAGPGSALDIAGEVTGRLGSLIQAAGVVSCDGAKLLTAQVTLAGVERAPRAMT